ncbi:MAG: FtsX-like permease family protein [bacterium]|nr:FtsX-like permease family protein [bacterium]
MKKLNTKAPESGLKILGLFLPAPEAESIAGDYDELYEDLRLKRGKIYCLIWYWSQIFKSVFSYLTVSFNWGKIMYRNYLKIALRNIKNHKGYSFINISGLAIGIACCTLILLWVLDELSFDTFHENADTLYRVTQENGSVTCAPLAPALKEEIPEVVLSTRYRPIGSRLIKNGETSFSGDRFCLVDADYFEMFTFPLVSGDPGTIFDDPFSIVLTKETAEKYFGDEDPIGKVLQVENRFSFTVKGIIQNVSRNSHMQFDILTRFDFINKLWGEDLNAWGSNSHLTYIQLQENSDPETALSNINDTYLRHLPEATNKLKLYPVTEIYLSKMSQWIDVEPGSYTYVLIFSIIALFILLIACINFMNLSTARSIKRAKEAGVRKVVGARKSDLIKQFYGESIISTLFAFVLAFVIIFTAIPLFNNLSGKSLGAASLGNFYVIAGLFTIAIFTGVLSGSYPAVYLSSFKPINVLKTSTLGSIAGKSHLRKILVTIQFVLTIFLITGTTVIYRQMDYINNRELGYDRENIILMPATNSLLRQISAAGQELVKNPDILSISISATVPGFRETTTSKITWEGKNPDETIRFESIIADLEFQKTFNLKIIEGRYFSRDHRSEFRSGVVVNEAAVKAMGIVGESPIGKEISKLPGYSSFHTDKVKIIGVVKDFHSRSFHHEISPLIILFSPYANDNLSIRIREGKTAETLVFLDDIWKRFVPDYPFEYRFFDERLNDLYNAEQRMGKLFNYFSILAIFISCLGLLGLASFITQQRTKEIGIRKTFGASISGILVLISKEFIFLIGIAVVIAVPISYYVTGKWLERFAFRTDLALWIFIAAGFITLVIAFLTISLQAFRAAQAKPVDSLRYE